MSFISAFDVMGPNMIGPSSSHTAGAARIAFLARKMLNSTLKKVQFTLYGSFAKTYHGHGTDRALLGGIMGFGTDDMRIRDSFEIAKDIGLDFSFVPNEIETDIHPNTVDILMTNENGDPRSSMVITLLSCPPISMIVSQSGFIKNAPAAWQVISVILKSA